jgi:hypothetical protein
MFTNAHFLTEMTFKTHILYVLVPVLSSESSLLYLFLPGTVLPVGSQIVLPRTRGPVSFIYKQESEAFKAK